jgi:hypothetical protein
MAPLIPARTDRKLTRGSSGVFRRAMYMVGTPWNNVGRWRRTASSTSLGSNRGMRTRVAPIHREKFNTEVIP